MHPLDLIIDRYHLLKHPFYQRWIAGTLTKNELQRYAAQYYPHVMAFPTYVSAVHSQSDDLKLRQALLDNLIEEEQGSENHPELWLRFGEALGMTRGDIMGDESLPKAKELVETFRRLTHQSLASGLGALYAYESQVPAIATQKIKGLKENYGITSERGLKFFSVHEQADEHHSATERNAIDSLSEEEKKEAANAVEEASKALWNFLSGLDHAAGIKPGAVCAKHV